MLSVVGYLMTLVLCFATRWAYRWETPQRTVMLGVACATWTICGWAAFRLTEKKSPSQSSATGVGCCGFRSVVGALANLLWSFLVIRESLSLLPNAVILALELSQAWSVD